MSFESDETKIWNASLKQVGVTNKQLLTLYKQSKKEVEDILLSFAMAQSKGGVISQFQDQSGEQFPEGIGITLSGHIILSYSRWKKPSTLSLILSPISS
jgi:hypothetical protein